jgi:lysophospholipase L1-like esterase
MIELRVAWAVVGVLLVITCRPPTVAFVTAALIPWAVGALALAGDRGERAARSLGESLSTPAGRIAVIVLLALGFAIALGFGPLGALLAATAFGCLLLVVAARGSGERTRGLLVGSALACSVTVLGFVALELLLSRPAMADRLGSPEARARWEANYDSLWTRNVLGLRSRYEQVARRPGVRRAVALGDSFTWGDKIAEVDSAWPGQLELLLSRGSSMPWEVFNLGQRGWTTANEAEMLRRLGWQLDPDVVVWQFFVNDTYASQPNFGRDGEQWRRLLPARLREHAAGRSVTLYLLERVVNQSQRGADAMAMYGPLFDPAFPGWRQFEAALAEVADSATARRTPVVFVLWPAYVPGSWTAESYPLRALYQQVGAAARRAGLRVLDLTPFYAEAGGEWRRWWALPWDSHPNAEGHALAAAAIARYITDSIPLPTGN